MERTQLNLLEGVEVLQQSSLDKFPWPLSENTVPQPARLWTHEDDVAVAKAARHIKLTADRFQSQTRDLSPAARIQWLLSHDDINFNGVVAVRQEPKWAERLERLVTKGEPIPIPYPLFCAIANPAKQLTRPGPNAGELAAIHWFRHVDELARAAYAPGLRIHILSDATLYNNALQNTLAFANAYIAKARTMVVEAGAAHCVTVHDYAQLLAPQAREFDALYNGFYRRMLAGDETLISADDRRRLLRSVRASVNTERFGLSFADQRALFGPEPDPSHPLAAEVERMAQSALRDQLAVKLSCVELNLPERLWPDHIRASCHKGLKSGVAVVGLRVYPEYYRRSQLLPYHGKPLVRADGRVVVRADGRVVVQPEFMLRWRAELTRVENEHGEAVLYRE